MALETWQPKGNWSHTSEIKGCAALRKWLVLHLDGHSGHRQLPDPFHPQNLLLNFFVMIELVKRTVWLVVVLLQLSVICGRLASAQALINQDITALNGLLSAYPALASAPYGWSATLIQTECTTASLVGVTCAAAGSFSFVSQLHVTSAYGLFISRSGL